MVICYSPLLAVFISSIGIIPTFYIKSAHIIPQLHFAGGSYGWSQFLNSAAFFKIIFTIRSLRVEPTFFPLFKELKNYRLKKSKEEQVKPYFIYNNQLKDLIFKMPRSKEDLLLVSGFGQVKADKYGNDILEIVKKY